MTTTPKIAWLSLLGLFAFLTSIQTTEAQETNKERIYKTASPTPTNSAENTEKISVLKTLKTDKVRKFLPNATAKRLQTMNKSVKSVFIPFDKVPSQNFGNKVEREEDFFFIAGKHIETSFENKPVVKNLSTVHKQQKKQKQVESRLYNIRFAPLNAQIETRIFFAIGEKALSTNKISQIEQILNSAKNTIERHRRNHPNAFVKVKIDLTGYSDGLGFAPNEAARKAKNKALSQQRAEEIGEYMRRNLYEDDFVQNITLTTEGKGEILPPGCEEGVANDPSRRICLISIKIMGL